MRWREVLVIAQLVAGAGATVVSRSLQYDMMQAAATGAADRAMTTPTASAPLVNLFTRRSDLSRDSQAVSFQVFQCGRRQSGFRPLRV